MSFPKGRVGVGVCVHNAAQTLGHRPSHSFSKCVTKLLHANTVFGSGK
jgi:hypothetical protein